MEPTQVETAEITLTVYMPKKLDLPVQIDPATGGLWPCAGMVNQRFLDAKSLLDAGIDVRWHMADGSTLDTETALKLIDANNAKIAEGQAIPNFEA